MTAETQARQEDEGHLIAEGVDEEPVESNRRIFEGRAHVIVATIATLYAAFHMAALNGLSISNLTGGIVDLPFLPTFPMETWNFRLVHIAGALLLGFLLFSASSFEEEDRGERKPTTYVSWVLLALALWSLGAALSFAAEIKGGVMWSGIDERIRFNETWVYGAPLLVATFGGIVVSWVHRRGRAMFTAPDLVLIVCGFAVAAYFITIYGTMMRTSTGTPFAPVGMSLAAIAGTALIMELTRRVAGLALIIISAIFLAYVFTGQYLPGFLNSPPIDWARFFSQIYTDAGILGPTVAVSSTYIILFIIFAAFLQASKVGDYFVNFAFAAAGRARGGPAKVAVFASGLMGMINGTSAGNVVATGSLTIPLMKRLGYSKNTAGAVEAAASTGGQIMPPIMGAGAFIMAEVTGIPYTHIAYAAIIPALLYFMSVYFMVDLEAAKLGMRGMREDELPKFRAMARRVFLFIPIVILIAALFMGYSVIRAGTYATVAAAVVSWLAPAEMRLTRLVFPRREGGGSVLSSLVLQAAIVAGIGAVAWAAVWAISFLDPRGVAIVGVLLLLALAASAVLRRRHDDRDAGPAGDATHAAMNLGSVVKAFQIAGVMSIQIIAVCACAGIIVGVISLTGVGARFSNLLLSIAAASQLLAMFFAMCIAVLLGMGMPTTAAYAVAASVVAPGLVNLGVPVLTAHFFVFYFAVVSAITPPVALASYAAAGISGANPMQTSVASFRIGLSAFIVPFMFFYNGALLMEAPWYDVIRACLTALVGVYLLSSGIQGWFLAGRVAWFIRAGLIVAALLMIEGGIATDLAGIALAAALFFVQKLFHPRPDATIPIRGAD